MNREPGSVVLDKGLNVLSACRGKHLRGGDRHILQQGPFILAPHTADLDRGNSPGINFSFVDSDRVVVVGQALSEPVEPHVPWPGTAQGVLEIRSEAAHINSAVPLGTAGAALKTVPSQKLRMLFLHIAETWNVSSVGAVSQGDVIFVPRNPAISAPAHAMVHQVVAKFPARICQPVGK